nr:metallophosphoesterase family protein [Hyphomonas sp. Mor2]
MFSSEKTPSKSAVLYAIGDVHGEASRLRRLHSLIEERHDILYGGRKKRLIHLGDYVDRGSDSAGVIESLIKAQDRMGRDCVCLQGNHEAMMLNGLQATGPTDYETWLMNGGEETVASYRLSGAYPIPKSHIKWLKALPKIHVESDDKLIFVHAGINPVEFPDEREEVYLWTRSPQFFDVAGWRNSTLDGWTVVHGHTPTDDFYPDQIQARSKRINIDTGAVFGGRLTAAIFDGEAPVSFIYA